MFLGRLGNVDRRKISWSVVFMTFFYHNKCRVKKFQAMCLLMLGLMFGLATTVVIHIAGIMRHWTLISH